MRGSARATGGAGVAANADADAEADVEAVARATAGVVAFSHCGAVHGGGVDGNVSMALIGARARISNWRAIARSRDVTLRYEGKSTALLT